jgi:hypothetical protein
MKALLTLTAVLFSALVVTAGENKACDKAKAECPLSKAKTECASTKLAAKECSSAKAECPQQAAVRRSTLLKHKGGALALR